MATVANAVVNNVPMYSGQLTVAVKLGKSEYGERLLCIEVDRKHGQNPLEVQLFDDADPSFLYTLKLTGEDYSAMKFKQGLLVDFEHFPEHFVNLLSKCADEKSSFKLVLTGEEESGNNSKMRSLQVVETTQFRNLCYLTLIMIESSDSDVKLRLLQKVTDLQNKNNFLELKVNSLERELREGSQDLKLKDQEMEAIKSKYEEEKSSLRMEAERALAAEKEKHSQTLFHYQQSAELDRKCVEDKFQDMIRQQEKQIASLKNQLETSLDLQRKLESTNRENAKQMELLEQENKQCKNENSNFRKTIRKLDSDYHEKEREVQALQIRLAAVEQELKDKNEQLADLHESEKHRLEEKSVYEKLLAKKEDTIQKQNMSLEVVSEDLIGSNALLGLHQREIASLKNKVRMSTEVAFELEKLLELKTKGLSALNKAYNESKKKEEELEQEVTKLKDTISKAEKSVQEKDKLLHEDKIVIDRLNQRIKELLVQEPAQSLTHWSYKSRIAPKFLVPESASTPITTSSSSVPLSHQSPAQPSLASRAPQTYLPVRARGPLPQGFSRTTSAATTLAGSMDGTSKNDGGFVKKDNAASECKDKVASEESKDKTKPEEKGNGKGSKESNLPHVGILRVNPPPRPSAYFNPAGRK